MFLPQHISYAQADSSTGCVNGFICMTQLVARPCFLRALRNDRAEILIIYNTTGSFDSLFMLLTWMLLCSTDVCFKLLVTG